MKLLWVLALYCGVAVGAGPAIRTQRAAVQRGAMAAPMEFRAVGVYNIHGGAGLQSCGGSPDPHRGGTWTSRAGVDACPTGTRVRASADGLHWTEWMEVHSDAAEEGGFAFFDQPQRWIETDRPVEVLFIDPGVSQAVAMNPPRVITRAEWGCPADQCAYRGGSPAYSTVTHLVVHHTAGANTASDWAAVVRSIWALHVNGNGWSDIGYNYLIAPDGALYEGRQGGDGVIGAHFSGVNTGTMGVSMMGTYSTVPAAERAMTTLVQMVAWHARRWTLDPMAETLHASSQLRLNVISGHRDAGLSPRASGTTECPGNAVYAVLPRVRDEVHKLLNVDCPVRVVAPSACASAGGGSMRLTFEGCTNAAVESRTEWIKVATDGTLRFDPNTGARRIGTVSVGPRLLSFTQAAAGEPDLPCVAHGGVLTAGSAERAPVVAGSLVSIYGANFPANPTIMINGNRRPPVLFANASQINVQLPSNVNTGTARLTVDSGPETLFWVTDAAPVIFVAQNHENGNINSPDAGVRPGAPLIVYLTGAGATTAAWSAAVGGHSSERLFLGPTPGLLGLYQANIVVPEQLQPGTHRLDLAIRGVSASVDVYVQ